MQKQKVNVNKSGKRWVIIVSVVVILALLTDIFMIGNIAYLVKWAQCGSRPVVAGKTFSVGFGAAPEHVLIRENPGLFEAKQQISGGFYCTIDQAKTAFPLAGQIDIQ